jgi:hypothetical protein
MRGRLPVASLGPMKTLWRGAAALVAVGLASLAACTGGSAPILTETPSLTALASATPSPSPSPTPLTDAELLALMPPEAAYPDVRGAIATAQFFLEQYAPVLETGDLTVWDALSMPECIFCESVRDNVSRNSAVGDFETGNTLALDTTRVVANYYSVDGFTYVTLPYQQKAAVVHHADGSTSSEDPGGLQSGSISLRMTLEGPVWRVSDVGVEVA